MSGILLTLTHTQKSWPSTITIWVSENPEIDPGTLNNMNQHTTHDTSLSVDIRRYLELTRRWFLWVLVSTVLGVVIGYLLTTFIQPRYSASAILLVQSDLEDPWSVRTRGREGIILAEYFVLIQDLIKLILIN